MNAPRRKLLPKLLCVGMLFASVLVLTGAGKGHLRGDRVGWARLQTPNPWWKRHAEGDPFFMRYLREQTSINLDPAWHQVDCTDLPGMSTYPLIFTQEIDSIPASARTNLTEYIARGGFLVIDTCVNPLNNPDPDTSFQKQVQSLKVICPEAKVVVLPPEHPIFRCHFQFSEGKPPHTARDDARWTKHPLYGIQIGDRMIGVLSLSGLQCGWARENQPMDHRHNCMKMLVNIYIYAMTQRA
jgi:hypothetical protein